MQKLFVIVLALAFLAPFGLPAQQTPTPLTNSDVVGMVKAALTSDIVVAKIKSSRCLFDTSPTALEQLKKSGVPNPVILAMVQAPRDSEATKPGAETRNSEAAESGANTVYVKCNVAPLAIYSAANYASLTVSTGTCNQALTVLDDSDGLYWKVRTEQGAVGFVPSWTVSGGKTEAPTTSEAPFPGPTRPASLMRPNVPSNMLRAIAWRGVPWATTSYYQQPGGSSTDCTGSGQWLGDIYQSNLSCTGSYTPSQNVPISWQHYTIYNLVQTYNSYLVLSCTRNWAWSKCSYLIPGDSFSYEYNKGQILVTGQRAGKKKEESLKYDIIASQPISH